MTTPRRTIPTPAAAPVVPGSTGPEEKVLRIGLLQGGRIIEERLLRRREVVTIGQSPTNTFYIPSPLLPTTLTLFDVRAGRYALVLSPELSGRVTVDEVVRSLDDIARAPESALTAGSRALPLDERTRGKLELGELSIIFQFVVPPPVAPRPQLPASARGGPLHAIAGESAFLICVLISMLVQGGFVALSMRYETPPERRVVVNRYVQQLKVDVEVVERKKRQSELTDKAIAGAMAAAEPAPGRRVRGNGSQSAGASSAALRPPPMPGAGGRGGAGAVRSEDSTGGGGLQAGGRRAFGRGGAGWAGRHGLAMRKTFLKAIVLDSPSDGIDGVGNALSRGHVDQIARAFDPPTAVTVARPTPGAGGSAGARWLDVVGSPSGLDGGQDGSMPPGLVPSVLEPPRPLAMTSDDRHDAGLTASLRPDAADAAPAKQPEETSLPHASISLAASADRGGGQGRLDSTSVTSVFKHNAGAFRSCYEARLREKPTLEGKIVIRFTIGIAGRVTNISVASNATSDSALGACVVEKVRNLRFDKPDNGEVTFTYPIVLSRGL